MTKIKKVAVFLVAPFFIILLYGILYWQRGIFPFGTDNIAYFDMAQSFVAIYESANDVLHGEKSIWYDWYSGAGESMVALVGWSVMNPINWSLFFVPKGEVINFFCIFHVMKVVLCSLTMQFYIYKKYGKSVWWGWMALFAILYANSGYMLQFYTNVYFLDAMILFPMVAWGLSELLEKGVKKWYILFLSFSLITSLYFSFMFILFIIFASFGYFTFVADETGRKRRTFILGISTITALGLSAWMWIPNAWQMLTSSRMKNGEELLWPALIENENILVNQKEMHFFCLEVVFAIILMGGIKFYKVNKKIARCYLFILMIVLIPVYLEAADLMWHTGSYQLFPMRFGFISEFVVLNVALDIFRNHYETLWVKKDFIAMVTTVFSALVGIWLGYMFYELFKVFSYEGIKSLRDYLLMDIMMIGYLICYMLWCINHRSFLKQIRYLILVLIVGVEIVVGTFRLIAPDRDNDYYVKETNGLREAWKGDLQNNNLERIKNVDGRLDVNYPLILRYPSISGWTNAENPYIYDEVGSMGYTRGIANRLHDTGGTIFTDALLGYKKAFSMSKLDVELYTCVDDSEKYYLYDCNYVLPTGIFVDDTFKSISSLNAYKNCFEYQNDIFRILSKSKENLFELVSMMHISKAESGVNVSKDYEMYNKFICHIENEGKKAVYIQFNEEGMKDHILLEENGVIKEFAYHDYTTAQIPMQGNNNVIFLAAGEGDFDIPIYSKADELEGVVVGIMDLELLQSYIENTPEVVNSITAEGRRLTMTVEVEDEGYLYLPIGYDKGWSCERNGEKVILEKCFNGAFWLVPLVEGENYISMTYLPRGMKVGVGISTIFLLFVFVVRYVTGYLEKKKWVLSFVDHLFSGIALLAIGIIYILPFISLCAASVLK